jgi:methylated-DNA-[protein]-cysteine S-methyltransferase
MQNIQELVYWCAMKYNAWQLYLAATDMGLCYVTLPNESLDTLRQWVHIHIPGSWMIEDASKLGQYQEQLVEYLRSERRVFVLPLDLRGTAFQMSVWKALTHIPYGETRSYTDLAMIVERPKAVRAVGAANGANPIPIIVPCHRVIGKDGTLHGFRGGLDVKAELLRLEGVRA